MDWHTPEDHGAIVSSEIPLQIAEKIANYDYIKNYAAQFMPETKIGLGISADYYTEGLKDYNADYAAVANANFQMFTAGNAMKHQSVVQSDGSLKLETVTPFIQSANAAGIEVFGHNFIWHTQQQQTYLKSLIAPEQHVETDSDIANLIINGDFSSGSIDPWFGWGNSSERNYSATGGPDGGPCIELVNPSNGSDYYVAQLLYDFQTPLVKGTTYKFRFKAKSKDAGGSVQFAMQNTNQGNGGGWKTFELTTSWNTYEMEYTCTKDDNQELCINFGKVAGTFYVDDIEFGEEKANDPMVNVLEGDSGDFEGGTLGNWGGWGNGSTREVSAKGDGYESDYCMIITNPTSANKWSSQTMLQFNDPLKPNGTYIIQFWAKSDVAGANLQFQTQNADSKNQGNYYDFEMTTTWAPYEYEFTINADYEDVTRIMFNTGQDAAKFYIDNVKFGEKIAQSRAAHRGTKIWFTLKTAEEKREALLTSMKEWIDGMAAACPTVKQWDVVNEPISDTSHKWRGVKEDDGSVTFGMDGDSEPKEDAENGLSLNWVNDTGNGHWYWGYFIGKDYAVKAFEYARAAIGEDAKLYVNEYGLETSPGKTAALIDFVNYIDQNGAKVDGIGTQMHITLSGTNNDAANNAEKVAELKEKVDAMFKTLAATGKLIRVSELDIAFGTSNDEEVSPSAAQYAAQSDAYQVVMDSYKENVPAAQRGGFCIWTLSDHKNEHEYWLKGDKPNLFDKNYARKHAYKGFCDGIAGYDISTDFSGDQWNVK